MNQYVANNARCRRLDAALQVIPGEFDPAVALVAPNPSRNEPGAFVCENLTVPEFDCSGTPVLATQSSIQGRPAYVPAKTQCLLRPTWAQWVMSRDGQVIMIGAAALAVTVGGYLVVRSLK